MQIMTDEQSTQITNDLVDFVHKVLVKKNPSPEELAILPEMTKILFSGFDISHIVEELNSIPGLHWN